MPKLKNAELIALLEAERMEAMAATQASELSEQRERATSYYNGDVSDDIPTIDGRSKAVSMDVLDTVEGLMPGLMEVFCGSDEVVKFEPVGPEDEQAAEQETDYVNHVFMQKNSGFMTLYSMIKDALLSKTGTVKIWWEEEEREHRETYEDLPDDAYALLAANPEVEIVEHTERPLSEGMGYPAQSGSDAQVPDGASKNQSASGQVVHDVTIATKKTYGCAKVMPVPPEEFGITRNSRTIPDAGYVFHEPPKTVAELLDDGYDEDSIAKIPTFSSLQTSEQDARDTVEESQRGTAGESINKVNRRVVVTEHYVRMDYDGTGPALWRVVTGSHDTPILLTRDGKPDIERVDFIPFAAITPVPVTHRFFGHSIADLVMEIQRIKTVMLRAMVDNAYLANNPRTEVPEAAILEGATIDDLLVSRPGGIVRTKQPGMLNVLQHPDIGGHVFPLLEYYDSVREWRTGVTRQGMGIDANALQNQSATAVAQMYSAAQAKQRLIARIFAETGIRDMFWLLHAIIRKHGQEAQTVRLRNKWVSVDPREWKERDDLTIHVGLGSGGKAEQMAGLIQLGNFQKECMLGGLSNVVTAQNIYSTGKELTKLLGHKNTDDFVTDPRSQPPPQTPPDPKMLQIQMQTELQQQKMQADAAHQQMKTQADIALAERKAQLDEHRAMFDGQIKQMVADHTMALERQKHEMDLAVAGQKHQMDMAVAANKAEQAAKPKVAIQHSTSQDIAGPVSEAVGRLAEHITNTHAAHTTALLNAVNAPRETQVIRDPKTNRAIRSVSRPAH